MRTFRHRFIVKAPITAVSTFHNDTAALKNLMPPPLQLRFNRLDPMGEGAVSDFSMGLGPLQVHWTAVHSNVTPAGFTDTQQRGPFKFWQHRHTFRAVDAQTTEVIDEVEAEPDGLISWLMWLTLPLLFVYRSWQTRRLSPKMAG